MKNMAIPIALIAVVGLFWIDARAQSPLALAAKPVGGQPGTPISSLPFTIDECGKYFLTDCLTGSAGQDGITVQADDVTLDLNGFSLIGVPGSGHGINVPAAQARITIQGGTIHDWVQAGIDASNASSVRVQDVTALNNGFDGIRVGSNSTVKDCNSSANTVDGVAITGDGCVIEDNHFQGNVGLGVHMRSGTANHIRGNVLIDNGIAIGTDAGVVGNLIVQNNLSDNFIDFFIVLGNAVGPEVNVSGVADISTVADSEHPQVNLIY